MTPEARDAADPLRHVRDRFALLDYLTYLDGNSLGALPKATADAVAKTVSEDWGNGLIRSWNHAGWIDAPARIGAKIAPLIGAHPHEVIAADSTSVNLFKLLTAALQARPGKIVTEPGNFPTDLYIAQGAANLLGRPLVTTDDVLGDIDDDTAVVLLTHVHYKTAAVHDMAAITAAAHRHNALVLWDLSHSAGAMPVDLNGAKADLAVGCGYKYLNGGPGAPAFLFVAERHHDGLHSPLTGWMGHAEPFAFTDDYTPAEGIRRFLCGTPPILGLAALEAGIDIFADLDLGAVFAKSRALTSLFIELIDATDLGFEVVTPRDPARRGSHVSLTHPHAWPICQTAIARGVIGDFRAPDILRFGFTPLYTRFTDVARAVETLADIIQTREYEHLRFQRRAAVT